MRPEKTMSNSWTLYPHPGKFEEEHESVPYFWESVLDGADDEAGPYLFAKIAQQDREKFPELGETFGLSMYEDDFGFVHADWYETESEYEDALARAEDVEDDGEGY